MQTDLRQSEIAGIRDSEFDVLIVGGGIIGASVFRELSGRGLRILLVDERDFAGGTSQASSMLIWGGIARMLQLEFAEIWKLSRSRDRFISEFPEAVEPQPCRLLQSSDISRSTAASYAAVLAYWLFGVGRTFPRLEKDYPEADAVVGGSRFKRSILFEEARVVPSDARLVLRWILGSEGAGSLCLNYCSLESGSFDSEEGAWKLDLSDKILGSEFRVRARSVVNCAGVWADRINEGFGIFSPYVHVLGKGVAVSFRRRPGHESPLMIEVPEYQDCLSLIPWGPVSVWGPSEIRVDSIEEGFRPNRSDIDYLLRQVNRHLADEVGRSDIVSVRCGIRPLAALRERKYEGDCRDLSRGHFVHPDSERPWITVYGGKITSSITVAQEVCKALNDGHIPVPTVPVHRGNGSDPYLPGNGARREEEAEFPGISVPVVSPEWCAEKEKCWTLGDYLRRRTTISQWSPRCGLGSDDENASWLERAALAFSADPSKAKEAVEEYRTFVTGEFDPLVSDR